MHLRRITRWTQHQADEVFISSRRIYCIARLGKLTWEQTWEQTLEHQIPVNRV
ncbi:hypothetical protein SOVF_060240 isoform B [Spinacia oleracea]|nr:hypothetical protein SOVF_060240 isoform B [Spinacia oleracea]